MGRSWTPKYVALFSCLVVVYSATQVVAENLSREVYEDRCKDDSFCKAYCLSTKQDTVTARCGMDLASCICITPGNHAVKVRFVEERNPVPLTVPTTPRPDHSSNNVQYINSQGQGQAQAYSNYHNVNQNSIAGTHQSNNQQSQPTPVLLECDASESSTRMCNLFCTMEITAWYGLCNVTSRACACFGVPLSAVQSEPITAIFQATAPATRMTVPNTKNSYSASASRPGYPLYQANQYAQQPQNHQQQQQWRPIQPSYQAPPQGHNNGYLPSSSPTVLHPATSTNQLQDSLPATNSFSASHTGQPSTSTSFSVGLDDNLPSSVPHDNKNITKPVVSSSVSKVTSAFPDDESEDSAPSIRKRRSLNETVGKGKESPSNKDLALLGDCTKLKCALACKRNNYFAPECTPKCRDGECVCECLPRL